MLVLDRYKQLKSAKIIRAAYRKHSSFYKSDCVFVSFPKSGRTWVRVLVGRVLTRKYDQSFTIELEQLAGGEIPYIYMTHDDATNPTRPLATKKRKYRNKKVIFLVRDPRDVVISYFFHLTRRSRFPVQLDISSFIRDPGYGINRVIDLMNIWNENRRIPKDFLLIKYEDLHRDPVGELRKIVGFAGINDVNDELLKEAVEFGSFDNMRQMELSNSLQNGRLKPRNPNDQESYKVRKGQVGGYRQYLSEEDVKYVDTQVKDNLSREYGYE